MDIPLIDYHTIAANPSSQILIVDATQAANDHQHKSQTCWPTSTLNKALNREERHEADIVRSGESGSRDSLEKLGRGDDSQCINNTSIKVNTPTGTTIIGPDESRPAFRLLPRSQVQGRPTPTHHRHRALNHKEPDPGPRHQIWSLAHFREDARYSRGYCRETIIAATPARSRSRQGRHCNHTSRQMCRCAAAPWGRRSSNNTDKPHGPPSFRRRDWPMLAKISYPPPP
jgi:hypothetical protein